MWAQVFDNFALRSKKLMNCLLCSRQSSRPKSNSYCQAGVIPFCPTGGMANTMPTVKPSDALYVYAMKAPVWEFKFGDLLAKFVSELHFSVICVHMLMFIFLI